MNPTPAMRTPRLAEAVDHSCRKVSPSSSSVPEVGLDDSGSTWTLREAVGDQAAEVDHADPVGDAHHRPMSCSTSRIEMPSSVWISLMVPASSAVYDTSPRPAAGRRVQEQEQPSSTGGPGRRRSLSTTIDAPAALGKAEQARYCSGLAQHLVRPRLHIADGEVAIGIGDGKDGDVDRHHRREHPQVQVARHVVTARPVQTCGRIFRRILETWKMSAP